MENKILKCKIEYKIKNKNLAVFYKSKFIKVKDVAVNKKKFSEICRKGCYFYGRCWTCPPFSPSFYEVSKKFKQMLVFIVYIPTKQFKRERYTFYKIYDIFTTKIYKRGIILEKKLDGILLRSGPCKLCKRCSAIDKKPCFIPFKKRYSLESVGVDVKKLASKLNHRLLWYKNKRLQSYVTVVSGVLTNKVIPWEVVSKTLNFTIK